MNPNGLAESAEYEQTSTGLPMTLPISLVDSLLARLADVDAALEEGAITDNTGMESSQATKSPSDKYQKSNRSRASLRNFFLATIYICGMHSEENLHAANIRNHHCEKLLSSRQVIHANR
jgi:hypothetical protein